MMGYLFGNIGQLAGFLVKQGESAASEKRTEKAPGISFESIFGSFANQWDKNQRNINGNNPPSGNEEFLEWTYINEDILKAIIEKQGNTINLELMSEEISRYLVIISAPTGLNPFACCLRTCARRFSW